LQNGTTGGTLHQNNRMGDDEQKGMRCISSFRRSFINLYDISEIFPIVDAVSVLDQVSAQTTKYFFISDSEHFCF